MLRLSRIIFLMSACSLLGGCFVSQEPLLTAAQADYPFPARSQFASYAFDTNKRGADGTLTRQGDHYVFEDASGKKSILFKLVGDRLLVAQVQTDDRYTYDLIASDGKTAAAFNFQCDPERDMIPADRAPTGGTSFEVTCTVTSLEQVVHLFGERMAQHAKPKTKYVLIPG